jgi:hypothetical protein
MRRGWRELRRFGFASLATLAMLLGCSGSSGVTGMAAQGLMSQMGGMGSMSKLAGSFLQTSAVDSRLSGLMDAGDVDAMQPKLSNQLCSMLGGGCDAEVSEDEIAKGAQKLTPAQSEAVTDNFSKSLGGMNISSALQGAVSKAVAPKLPGIIGALL